MQVGVVLKFSLNLEHFAASLSPPIYAMYYKIGLLPPILRYCRQFLLIFLHKLKVKKIVSGHFLCSLSFAKKQTSLSPQCSINDLWKGRDRECRLSVESSVHLGTLLENGLARRGLHDKCSVCKIGLFTVESSGSGTLYQDCPRSIRLPAFWPTLWLALRPTLWPALL